MHFMSIEEMYIRTLFTYFDEKLFVYRKEKSKIYYYQHHSFFFYQQQINCIEFE